jgi:hypothetical protein
MRQPLPTNERLDEHLLEVVCVLRAAIKQGLSHPNDTEMANRAIADSKEILDVIMAGNVNEWLD